MGSPRTTKRRRLRLVRRNKPQWQSPQQPPEGYGQQYHQQLHQMLGQHQYLGGLGDYHFGGQLQQAPPLSLKHLQEQYQRHQQYYTEQDKLPQQPRYDKGEKKRLQEQQKGWLEKLYGKWKT